MTLARPAPRGQPSLNGGPIVLGIQKALLGRRAKALMTPGEIVGATIDGPASLASRCFEALGQRVNEP